MYFGFVNSLKRASSQNRNAIVAEVKTFSPLYGDLLRGRRIESIVAAYENAGAAAISYITAKKFKGDFDTLKKIVRLTELPVLRKDFITDKEEIERSSEAEVSALLLIARHLKERTAEMVDFCFEHSVEPVVEIHSPEDAAYNEKARCILINNRDIDMLEKDGGNISVTARISGLVKGIKISGSGISCVNDLLFVLEFVDAALIGTAFMMADDTESFVRSFVEARR